MQQYYPSVFYSLLSNLVKKCYFETILELHLASNLKISQKCIYILNDGTPIQNETVLFKKFKIQSCLESKMTLVTFVMGILKHTVTLIFCSLPQNYTNIYKNIKKIQSIARTHMEYFHFGVFVIPNQQKWVLSPGIINS